MSTYEHVLAPGKIGRLELKNRVVMPPMGTGMCTPEGHFSDRQIAYYAERARGGTALVVSEIALAVTELEDPTGLVRMDTDDCTSSLRALADAIHEEGAKLCVQLSAGQGRNNPSFTADRPPVSASDNPAFFNPQVVCRPLETREVQMIVRRFAEAAVRCVAAGADMIDIHGHTGYLIDQFLGPQWNRREDQYGGSVENRARLAVEIVQAVKAVAPRVPVSFRLSVDNLMPGGRTVEEAQEVARLLEAAGVDLMMADDGSYEAMDFVFPPYYLGDACLLSAARAVKQVLSIPVLACGNLTPENAESLLAAGDADFVGVGRGLIADPEWVDKLAEGRRDEIRPCIRCNQMCVGNVFAGIPLSCAVNPQAGFEAERTVIPAAQHKHVAVVGAGPAGLEAARVAALRGHTVDIYERAPQLGGVLWPAATPDFKSELRAMIGWWERQIADLPVTVHLGTEITADSPELAAADDVILATGSLPTTLTIPGIDGDNVLEVIDAHSGRRQDIGHRVVIAGGGLSGADLALELAESGHEVTIVEMTDVIAADMLFLNKIALLRGLMENHVRMLTGHTVTEIDDKGLTAVGPRGETHVDADTVVMALGVRPEATLATALGARPNVHAIGDCVQPAKVGEAVNAGFLAALTL